MTVASAEARARYDAETVALVTALGVVLVLGGAALPAFRCVGGRCQNTEALAVAMFRDRRGWQPLTWAWLPGLEPAQELIDRVCPAGSGIEHVAAGMLEALEQADDGPSDAS